MPKSTLFPLLPFFALLAAGCAGLGDETRRSEADARMERLLQSQQRAEMRLDEVTRNVIALRERLDAQEARLKALSDAERELPTNPTPAPPAVKEEPLPPEPPLPASPPAAAPPAPPTPPAQPQGRDPAADLYRKAFLAFREGRHGQAILDFEEFLRKHPNHEYADSAQYWIGEAYYSQGEYEQSAVEFNRVVERYPGGTKAPEALLKIGLCYQKAGDPEKARVFWRRLVSQHPRSEAAQQAKGLMER
jgi:tol-pal system protein YbgF